MTPVESNLDWRIDISGSSSVWSDCSHFVVEIQWPQTDTKPPAKGPKAAMQHAKWIQENKTKNKRPDRSNTWDAKMRVRVIYIAIKRTRD